MKNGILLLSAFVLMLSTITAQVGGAAGGGTTPTTQGGSPAQNPAAGSESKPTDKKVIPDSGPSTDKKAIPGTKGSGPRCCGRLLVNKPTPPLTCLLFACLNTISSASPCSIP